MIRFLSFALIAACGLAGCTTSPSKEENPKSPALVKVKVDLTPLTRYLDGDRNRGGTVSYENAYTKLIIVGALAEFNGADDPDAIGAAGYKERYWLHRYLMGLKEDINLSVKIRNGNYEETVSVVTLSSTSDRNGSSWDRDVTHDVVNLPWFLVTPGVAAPVPQITTEYRSSRAMESGIATVALQASLSAIKSVSPQATVVTKLSETGTRERAAAIDKVIGKIFTSKIGETHRSDRSLGAWRADGGIRLTLSLPEDSSKLDGAFQEVGSWNISFARPRPSIFSNVQICSSAEEAPGCQIGFAEAERAVYRERSAAAILAFPLIRNLSGDTTVRAYLLQQGWYMNAQASFTRDMKADQAVANAICLHSTDTVLGLGLNRVDAALVTWAVMTGVPMAQAMDSQAWLAPACKKITEQVEVSLR